MTMSPLSFRPPPDQARCPDRQNIMVKRISFLTLEIHIVVLQSIIAFFSRHWPVQDVCDVRSSGLIMPCCLHVSFYAQRRDAPLFAPRCGVEFRQIESKFHAARDGFCVEAPAHIYIYVGGMRAVIFAKWKIRSATCRAVVRVALRPTISANQN